MSINSDMKQPQLVLLEIEMEKAIGEVEWIYLSESYPYDVEVVLKGGLRGKVHLKDGWRHYSQILILMDGMRSAQEYHNGFALSVHDLQPSKDHLIPEARRKLLKLVGDGKGGHKRTMSLLHGYIRKGHDGRLKVPQWFEERYHLALLEGRTMYATALVHMFCEAYGVYMEYSEQAIRMLDDGQSPMEVMRTLQDQRRLDKAVLDNIVGTMAISRMWHVDVDQLNQLVLQGMDVRQAVNKLSYKLKSLDVRMGALELSMMSSLDRNEADWMFRSDFTMKHAGMAL